MLIQQILRKELLIAQHETAKICLAISSALASLDPDSRISTIQEALTAQRIVKRLWDLLPNEFYSYTYSSPAQIVSQGSWCLRGLGNPLVLFQLGWGALSFRTTLQAAWKAWPNFADLCTETFNTCIVPDSMEWYLIRAGRHLYPMRCSSSETPTLILPPS